MLALSPLPPHFIIANGIPILIYIQLYQEVTDMEMVFFILSTSALLS